MPFCQLRERELLRIADNGSHQATRGIAREGEMHLGMSDEVGRRSTRALSSGIVFQRADETEGHQID